MQHLHLHLLLLLHQDLAPGSLTYQLGHGRCVLERLERQRACLRCLVEQEFLSAVPVELPLGNSLLCRMHCYDGHVLVESVLSDVCLSCLFCLSACSI